MAGTWVKNPGYVLAGNGTYEQNSIQEPCIIADPTGVAQLRMWYTAGWSTAGVAMATSNDGGLTWTRAGTGFVIGNGAGGVTGQVAHTGLWDEAGGLTLHMSYTDPTSGATTLRRVTSTDGGLTWGSPVTILSPGGWETGRWGNSACVKKAGTWHLLYECMDASNVWQMGYATSTDGATFTRQNGGNPLASLQVGSGMHGGPDLHLQADGTWELFYHASTSGNLPTRIYRAISADMIYWERRPGVPVLDMSLSYEVDQVADPCVLTIGGQRVMFYEGVDNTNAVSKLNRAVFTPA